MEDEKLCFGQRALSNIGKKWDLAVGASMSTVLYSCAVPSRIVLKSVYIK